MKKRFLIIINVILKLFKYCILFIFLHIIVLKKKNGLISLLLTMVIGYISDRIQNEHIQKSVSIISGTSGCFITCICMSMVLGMIGICLITLLI